MRKDVRGGIIGLAFGIWVCFIFAVVYFFSFNGVSELFGEMFNYAMLYFPSLISPSIIVVGIIGIIFWGVIGALVGLLIIFLNKSGGEAGRVSVEDFKKFGKILDDKIARSKMKTKKEGLEIKKHLESHRESLAKKHAAGRMSGGDFKKFGNILDSKIAKAEAKMKVESLEIKKDLEKLGKTVKKKAKKK